MLAGCTMALDGPVSARRPCSSAARAGDLRRSNGGMGTASGGKPAGSRVPRPNVPACLAVLRAALGDTLETADQDTADLRSRAVQAMSAGRGPAAGPGRA